MPYIEPSRDQVAALQQRGIDGPVEMLNLLRFREIADYSRSPQLAPDGELSGAEAYAEYSRCTIPHLQRVGAEVVWMGRGGAAMIGPLDERWDVAFQVVRLTKYPPGMPWIHVAAAGAAGGGGLLQAAKLGLKTVAVGGGAAGGAEPSVRIGSLEELPRAVEGLL